jgi:hypothetical protein
MDRPDAVRPGRSGKDGGEQVGWVALVIWAAAVDPADVPMIRSASVTSNPGIEQAGDDTDHPRIACRSATAEDQRSLTGAAFSPCRVDLRLILVGPRPLDGCRRGEVRG